MIFFAFVFALYLTIRIVTCFDLTGTWKRCVLIFFGITLGLYSLGFAGFGPWHLEQFTIIFNGIFLLSAVPLLIEYGISFFTHETYKRPLAVLLPLLLIMSVYSAINGTRTPVVERISIEMESLPKNLEGFTIAHLSDIHIGEVYSEQWVKDTVKQVNEQNPDLIAITGDTVEWENETGRKWANHLGELRAKHGVFMTMGNHDHCYGSRLSKCEELSKKTGIRILNNENVTIQDSLRLSGINNTCGYIQDGRLCDDFEGAFEGTGSGELVVLLSHQPDIFDEAVKRGVDLQLSGHTHCGQIPLLELFVTLHFKYPRGVYRNGNSHIHTSCGTGLWDIPMRLFSNNEITLVQLVRK